MSIQEMIVVLDKVRQKRKVSKETYSKQLGWGARSLDMYVQGKTAIPAERLKHWAEYSGYRLELR